MKKWIEARNRDNEPICINMRRVLFFHPYGEGTNLFLNEGTNIFILMNYEELRRLMMEE